MSQQLTSLGSISAISLFVEDVPQARQFYQDVFDVPVVYEDDVSAALKFEHLIVNLLATSEAPTLVEPAPVGGADAGARFQLSIWVEDVDAVHADLERRGITGMVGPVDRPWGMRTVTFTDPAGHCWEIATGTGS